MSEPHAPTPKPAGGPEAAPGDDLPPKTDADARRQDPGAINPGMANEGGDDAPDPGGMIGEGAGEDRGEADTSEASGMLNQGGERSRDAGGMLGEG